METAIDLQRSIEGRPAMYCAVALGGKLLAGFAGFALQTKSANGPSTVVRIGVHTEMANASAALIQATGATGFIGFDFMIEEATGDAYLLECNPRPIQIGHLGPRIGVNLCDALACALRGEPNGPEIATDAQTVTLFPQEWLRDPEVIGSNGNCVDVPWDDPSLLRAMVELSTTKHRSSTMIAKNIRGLLIRLRSSGQYLGGVFRAWQPWLEQAGQDAGIEMFGATEGVHFETRS